MQSKFVFSSWSRQTNLWQTCWIWVHRDSTFRTCCSGQWHGKGGPLPNGVTVTRQEPAGRISPGAQRLRRQLGPQIAQQCSRLGQRGTAGDSAGEYRGEHVLGTVIPGKTRDLCKQCREDGSLSAGCPRAAAAAPRSVLGRCCPAGRRCHRRQVVVFFVPCRRAGSVGAESSVCAAEASGCCAAGAGARCPSCAGGPVALEVLCAQFLRTSDSRTSVKQDTDPSFINTQAETLLKRAKQTQYINIGEQTNYLHHAEK